MNTIISTSMGRGYSRPASNHHHAQVRCLPFPLHVLLHSFLIELKMVKTNRSRHAWPRPLETHTKTKWDYHSSTRHLFGSSNVTCRFRSTSPLSALRPNIIRIDFAFTESKISIVAYHVYPKPKRWTRTMDTESTKMGMGCYEKNGWCCCCGPNGERRSESWLFLYAFCC